MNREPLNKVATVIAGQSPPSTTYNDDGDGLPFFQGKADFTEKYPKVRMWCNSERRKEAVPGDVLISVRAPVGTVNLCNQRSIIGRGLSAIRPNQGLNSEYLYYFLKSQEEKIASLGTGSTFKAITQNTLGKIEVPLPPLEDQKRIAYLLSKVEGLIAQRKQRLQQLDDLLKSVFHDMFGDPVKNEKGWETGPLEQLCDQIVDCPHSTPKYSDEETGNFCVRSSDIVEGYLELANTYQVDQEVYTERIKRHEPTKGDIVYSREGGRLGNAARVDGANRICLGQRMMLFRVNQDNESEFLWALLESVPFKQKLKGMVGGGAAPRVNIKDLIEIEVIEPPKTLQEKFAEIVQVADGLRIRFRSTLQNLEGLYSVLSQRAFKGELELSNITAAEQQTEVKDKPEPNGQLPESSSESSYELPEPTAYPLDESARINEETLRAWLTAYSAHLGEEPISADRFLMLVDQKLTDMSADRYAEWIPQPINASTYERVKKLIFEELEANRLHQHYDDKTNRVRVSAAKE